MVAMSTLHWHRMSVPFLDFPPELENFSALGLFFAEPGDVVLLNECLPKDVHDFYSAIGLISPDVTVLKTERNKVSEHFLGDLQDVPIEKVDFFMNTSVEEALTSTLGIRGEPRLSKYEDFVSKHKFKNVVSRLGLGTPRYSRSLRKTSFQIKKDIVKFILRGHGAFAVKSDSSVSGYNMGFLTRDEFIRTELFNHDLRPPCNVQINDEEFFVETWVANVVAAPSFQYFLGDEVEFISSHNQLFYDNDVTYRGCQSSEWLPQHIINRGKDEGRTIMEEYLRSGYQGHMGLNAVVNGNGELYWLETNPRRVMSSYAFQISSRVAKDKVYATFQVEKPSWARKSASDILRDLSQKLFDPETGEGIIPYHFLLDYKGSAVLFFAADDKEGVLDQIAYVNQV